MKKHAPDPNRLCRSVRQSRQMMEYGRKQFAELTRRLAGNRYSDSGYPFPVVVPLLSMYQTFMKRSLVSQNPRFAYTTMDMEIRPAVNAMQEWVNGEVERMRLSETLQNCAGTALAQWSVAMVHLASPWDAANLAWNCQPGDPIVSEIDNEDFVIDMQARRIEEAAYMGNKIRVPMYAIENFKAFGKHRKDLEVSIQRQFNDNGGDERASAIGRGSYGSTALDPEDMVELWYIYYTRTRTLYMFTDRQMTGCSDVDGEPFHEMQWVGPDRGPYEMLCYEPLPSNLLPVGPMMRLMDCDEACNTAARKLWGIIERIKEGTLIDGPLSEAGDGIVSLNDGEVKCIPGLSSVQQVVFSGKHAQVVDAIMRTFKDLFSFAGGNLELLGGRGTQAGTARQEQLLQENASAGVQDLQDKTHTFVTRIGERLSWYWWNHPRKVMESQYAPAGLKEFGVPTPVYPGLPEYEAMPFRRVGAPPAMRCDPYSLRKQTPQQKAALLKEFLQTMYAPMAQLFMQDGVKMDMRKFAEKLGAYEDNPDLAECLHTAPPLVDSGGGSHDKGTQMAAVSERRYVRDGVSEKGADQDRNIIASGYGSDLGGSQIGQG